jgi:hypothetical protein
VVDIPQLGFPDTLNGLPEYRPLENPVLDFSHTRSFDMVGTGPAPWEWIGPRTPLLVASSQVPLGSITGRELFGRSTWGKELEHGYEPLSTLDSDANGVLEGPELEGLWLWFDADSDAVCDHGEVFSVASLLSKISVDFDPLQAYPMIPLGACLMDGTWVPTWDWWSRRYSYPLFVRPDSRFVEPVVLTPSGSNAPVCLYRWESDSDSSVALGGYLRFLLHDGRLFVFAISDTRYRESGFIRVAFAPVYYRDGRLFWSIAQTSAEVHGDRLYGVSDPPPGSYVWRAQPFDPDGDFLGSVLAGVSDEQHGFALAPGLDGVPIFIEPLVSSPGPVIPLSLEGLLPLSPP